jgi:RING finger protein 113A
MHSNCHLIIPIKTSSRCKHYFCEKCALAQYKKSQRCFVCGAQTRGIFNPAKEIIARLKIEEAAAAEAGPSHKSHAADDAEEEDSD